MQSDKVHELISETCGACGGEVSETQDNIQASKVDDPFLFVETLVQLALEDDDEDETLEDLLAAGVIRGLDYEIDEDGQWTLVFRKDHLE